MIRGSQKGGGGSDVWEKFPNNIVFFCLATYLRANWDEGAEEAIWPEGAMKAEGA